MQRLALLHRIDRLTKGVLRQDAVDARGHEPRGFRASLQERAQILLAPGVVDDQKNAAIAERLGKRASRGVDRLEFRRFAGQPRDEVRNDRQEIFGLLAELGPQDAIKKSVLNVRIMGEGLGEGRLAIAARAAQGRGDGDRVALRIEQLPLERVKFLGALHEIGGRLGAIMGTRFWRLSF